MEIALYAPGLGYYSNGLQKFGSAGDFITAPETSALFGRCLAHSIAPVLQSFEQPDILEFGAGSGVMAVDVLSELSKRSALPDRYLIVERSASLKQRQRQRFERDIPEMQDRIQWIDDVSNLTINGVVIANEVLDALSVKRFIWSDNRVVEQGVCINDTGFAFQKMSKTDEAMSSTILALQANHEWCEGYQSEWSPMLRPWIKTIADCLTAGAVVFVDYGSVQSEYYHPQRHGGSLMCHYRHRAHPDPFVLPGLQDITAYVDFTAVAEAADQVGLQVAGFTTQTHFLLNNGLDAFIGEVDPADQKTFFKLVSECKTLTMPGEMGERFKAIALTRNSAIEVGGFAEQDLRGRL